MSHEPRELVSVAEAAQRLGVSKQSVRRWIHHGILPAYLIGANLWRVDAADLEPRRIDPAGGAR